MKKFLVKIALKTFLILLALIAVGFAVFNFVCPQHMATFAEQIGKYDIAIKYAQLRYYYTDDPYDLARCFEDAILSEDDGLIVEYGNQFYQKEGHEQVMADLSSSGGLNYEFIFGAALSKSRYATGDFEGALALAVSLNGDGTTFVYGCPLMSLAIRVIGRGDSQNARVMAEELNKLQLTDAEHISNRDMCVARLNSLASQAH